MTKPVSISKKPRKQHTPEFRNEALKLAERIGVAAAARELNLYESQLYAWRSKQQQQMSSSERESELAAENVRLKRQLAEQAEELAILQKAATYFAKRLNFSIFKLSPRSSFRNPGEQIDGSFRLNDDFYLLEAKWHQNRTPAADLHVFEGKLSTKAKWARGVFIRWMGFTDEGLTAFGKGKRVICVSGCDLYHSLSHGIALPDLLDAKLRHAAETGEPYAQFDRLYTLKGIISGTPK